MGRAGSGSPLTPSPTTVQWPGKTGGRECPPFCLSVPHSDSCAPGTRARSSALSNRFHPLSLSAGFPGSHTWLIRVP